MNLAPEIRFLYHRYKFAEIDSIFLEYFNRKNLNSNLIEFLYYAYVIYQRRNKKQFSYHGIKEIKLIKHYSLLIACTPLELAWVLDVSGTITKTDFELTQKFVNTIQAKIGLADNKNKASVTTFGNDGHRDIKCNDYQTVYDFKDAVGKLKRRPDEFTNTRDGLEKGQHSLHNDGCGVKDVRKIIILLTDGLANRGTDKEKGLIKASKTIQESGTIILVVAVGQFSDNQLLKMVASENIHRTKDQKGGEFETLNNEQFVGDVKRAICGNVVPTKGNYK